ncbi:MAG: L-threonylcarbamoyladenylate synthase [Flavobacteriaceae bacterium]|jgi:L-threonylcarbamoyladenylate synthase|nr:L-threonylcarbamoyladenylate synthase [Flavobacteriaceae bacterium]
MVDLNKEVHNAFEVIKNGGIILYPTDTVWGIGCDATNSEAIKKIFTLKKRTESKSMIALVSGDRMLYQIFNEIPETAFQIWDLSEKPTTIILDKPKNIAKEVVAEDNSVGIRIVKEPFCYNLMERMKKPLVSTSANLSGSPTPTSFSEINSEIIKGVDYVVNLHRDKKMDKPSTIIKLTLDNRVTIVRK